MEKKIAEGDTTKEDVQIFMIEQERGNFVLNEPNFFGVAALRLKNLV